MKSPTKHCGQQGFTLIELLAVVGVIAVLMALLFPVIGKARSTGERTKAASNLRQICLAYTLHTHEGSLPRILKADTPQEWAGALARSQGFNEAALFYIDADPLLENHYPLPPSILNDLAQGPTANLDPTFKNIPISYTVVSNVPPSACPATTPIVWTRGLKPDGTWALNSPYAGRGGHIGFLDGPVAWYSSLINDDGIGLLTTYGTGGTPTANIKKALPPSAKILESP